MNPRLEKFNWYNAKNKINYDTYIKYNVLTTTLEKYDITDIIFRYVGDVLYNPPYQTVKKKTKIIFNNQGNVNAFIYKRNKTVFFDNDGDVVVNLVGKTPCNLIFINRGNVIIRPSSETCPTELLGEIIFANHGNVEITNLMYSGDKLHIYNNGDFDFKGVFFISAGIKFNNVGNVHITNPKRLERKILFNNGGDVIIESCDVIQSGTEITFKNDKNVFINLNQYTKSLGEFIFNNKLDSIIANKLPIVAFERLVFNNKNVSFENVLGIQAIKEILFNNQGDVDINCAKLLRGTFAFNNTGCVHSKNLETIETPSLVSFNNGKSINLSNLKNNDSQRKFSLSNGGDVILGNNDNILSQIKNDALGYTKTKDKTLYSNLSYIKRYNIPVNNGKIILYKAIDKIHRTALYDKESTIWKIGEMIEHPYWNPYDNEIGKGKYVASISPKSFHELTKSNRLSYIAIEIDIYDLYEYPFGKYPQFIGFRKGKILYETDKDKNILIMKYKFAKDFYDYMESINGKDELVMLKFTNKIRTNKFYYDNDGNKQRNPYYDKLFKKVTCTYKYGINYYEERKKIEPDWVPDTKRGTYTTMPDNPLLQQNVGTGNVSMSFVNLNICSIDYFYQDKSGDFHPWNEEELGDVKTFMPNYTYENKDKLSVTIHKCLADSIYSLSHINKIDEDKYDEIKTFYNEDYIYKNLI